MKIPSEEILEATISEMEAVRQMAHKDKGEPCEFCALCDEMDKRNNGRDMEKDGPCLLDRIPIDVATSDPKVMMILTMFNHPLIGYVTLLTRAAFLMGMKAAMAQSDQDSLNALMDAPPKE